jgi:hypothetical protein
MKTEALKAILDVPKAEALKMDGPRAEALKAILDAPKAARTMKAKALGIIVDSQLGEAILGLLARRKPKAPEAKTEAPKAITDAPRPQAIEDAPRQLVPRASSAPPSQLSDADQGDALVRKRETGKSKAQVIKEFREEMQGRDDKWIKKILAAVERRLKERKQLVVRGRSSSPTAGGAPNLEEGRTRSRSRGGVGSSVSRAPPVVRTVAVGRR